jgi:uncharacterized protein (DUF2252 family)
MTTVRDPIEILISQAETRTPALVPIRHGRMMRSPFAFYRGAAAVMAADLAGTEVSGVRAQLCGDAHLANFGVFAAPDRRLVFDVNDFDETHAGPWEWDVKRLAASVEVAGRDRGLRGRERRDAVRGAARAYRKAMRSFAAMRAIDVWYSRLDEDEVASRVGGSRRKDLDKAVAKARRKDSLRALDRLTYDAGGEPRIISDPPLIVPLDEIPGLEDPDAVRAGVEASLRNYQRTLQHNRRHLLNSYRIVDIAHKVVGVGSVGTRCWIVLLLGRDATDPLFMQVKEAQASAIEPYAGRRRGINQGRRVVEGQQLMQAASDAFLGWIRVDEDLDGHRRDYYIRQLWDAKASVRVETMSSSELTDYAGVCGWTLARAHARSGDPAAIAAALGRGDGFDREMARFAQAYAAQNEEDHAALVAAVESGRVPAQQGL